LLEMIVVDLDGGADLAEGGRNDPFPERPVDEV